MTPRPKHVRLRTYQVGFGDCLLLTVTYASKLDDGRLERHVLIDFGSREQRPGGPKMRDIAAKIAEHCDPDPGGDGQSPPPRLDVVVATHRHQDHVKGFGDETARAHLDALKPGLVVRPWTDVPEADSGDPALGLDEDSRAFITLLEGVHRQAAYIDQHFALDEGAIGRRAKELAALGIKNAPAVATLEQWASDGDGSYVKAGDTLDLEHIMPGVEITVVGPPTLSEVARLTSYAKESEEYWLRLAKDGTLGPLIRPTEETPIDEALAVVAAPGSAGAAGWLVRELSDQERLQALSIVEGFDDVLNNTSIILHVKVGKRTMLLAGDAQAENWSLSLDKALGENGRAHDPSLEELLAEVELYKIGHHGSLNATPKRLYDLWLRRHDSGGHELVSVLTTLTGVYDKSVEGAVPKRELLEGLKLLGPVHSTEDLPDDVWWFDLEAPAAGDAAFVLTLGPLVT